MKIKANGSIRATATAGVLSLGLLVAPYSSQAAAGQAEICKNGISQAYAELEQAKAQGLDGVVAVAKAGSLLTAAKVKEQFEKYPNCIDKVERARKYIRQARSSGSG